MPEFNFVFKIIMRAFWLFIFLGVLCILLALSIFLEPDLLAYLVSAGLIVFGIVLISLGLWIRKYAKINFRI